MTDEVLQKKDRVKETINATLEDIQNLYVVAILDKITLHFEKKLFGKEEEFLKEARGVANKNVEIFKDIPKLKLLMVLQLI